MDMLSVLFSQQRRRIGAIVPSVVISEKHSDALEITEHPVEIGAPVWCPVLVSMPSLLPAVRKTLYREQRYCLP